MGRDTVVDAGIRSKVSVTWAPVLLEPVIGSGERLTVAAAAIDTTGNARCVRALRPDVVRAVFGDRASYFGDIVDLIVESLESWLRQVSDFAGWVPPLEGVSLGSVGECLVEDVDVALGRGLPLVSFLHREPKIASTPRPPSWQNEVLDGLRAHGERYARSANAKVHLADRGVPATFTFLSQTYATNLVVFGGGSTETILREAKWKAWNLDRLGDAKSYLFRPANRELIAAIPQATEGPEARWEDAFEEIESEASRRQLGVVRLPTPGHVVEHILEQDAAA